MQNSIARRDIRIDKLRGFSIFLVVLGHTSEIFIRHSFDQLSFPALHWLWVAIYSFHMPAFFFVSGLTQKRPAAKSTLQDIIFLLACVIFIHMAGLLVMVALQYEAWRVREKALSPFFGGYFSIGPGWFLWVLAWSKSIIYFMDAGRMCRVVSPFIFLASTFMLIFNISANSMAAVPISTVCMLVGRRFGMRLLYSRSTLLAGVSSLALLQSVLFNSGCAVDYQGDCFSSLRGALLIDGNVGYIPIFALGAFGGICLSCMVIQLIFGMPSNMLSLFGRNSFNIFLINSMFFQFSSYPLSEAFQLLSPNSIVAILAVLFISFLQIGLSFLLGGPLTKLTSLIRRFSFRLSERIVSIHADAR